MREGDVGISSATGVLGLGVQLGCVLVGVVGLANRDVAPKGPALVGDPVGVMCRRGEGEAGDSGLRLETAVLAGTSALARDCSS